MLPGLLRRMIRRGNYRRKFGQRFAPVRRRRRLRAWRAAAGLGALDFRGRDAACAASDPRRCASCGPACAWSSRPPRPPALLSRRRMPRIGSSRSTTPLTHGRSARRALETVRPERLIFIEAVWPNLLAQAAARGIPTSLVARLSPRSEARFRRFRFITGPIFRLLDAISVQEPRRCPKWESLGAEAGQIHLTGNIKFDQPCDPDDRAGGVPRAARSALRAAGCAGAAGRQHVSGRGRDARAHLHAAAAGVSGPFPDRCPRHVERANEAAAEITEAGLTFALRSAAAERETPPGCLLVNTTGELRAWYELATVVFIGKSLSPAATGGQNPVEPVFAGKPVLFGPRMDNFRAVVSAACRDRSRRRGVATKQPWKKASRRSCATPPGAMPLAARAREIVAAHQGATGADRPADARNLESLRWPFPLRPCGFE